MLQDLWIGQPAVAVEHWVVAAVGVAAVVGVPQLGRHVGNVGLLLDYQAARAYWHRLWNWLLLLLLLLLWTVVDGVRILGSGSGSFLYVFLNVCHNVESPMVERLEMPANGWKSRCRRLGSSVRAAIDPGWQSVVSRSLSTSSSTA